MTPPTERCPTCDRDGCPRLRYWHTPMNQHPDDITGCLACSAMRDCEDGDELDAASGYDGIQVQTARSGR